jgi:hypothetical protein
MRKKKRKKAKNNRKRKIRIVRIQEKAVDLIRIKMMMLSRFDYNVYVVM